MRLLPQQVRAAAGWTPYIWLVWISYFLFDPALHPFSIWRWVLSVTVTLVFLALYFWGYWLRGKQRLWVITALGMLGVVFMPGIGFIPRNYGACGFFIYAASFAGFAGGTTL